MSLHPTPSPLALRVGSLGPRDFVWDAIADNDAPGIRVSESLPIAVSHYLAGQVGEDRLLVVTDSSARWAGFRQVTPGNVDAITELIRPIVERADRSSLAMLVFDVAVENWTAELAGFCDSMLRQGRSYGLAVLVRGPIASTPEASDPRAFPLVLTHSADRPFPELAARYRVSAQHWHEQELTLHLQPA